MEIYKSFGMDAIEGIPRVFLVSKSGKVLNLETNDHWRIQEIFLIRSL